jgi:hypothetical protein
MAVPHTLMRSGACSSHDSKLFLTRHKLFLTRRKLFLTRKLLLTRDACS